MVRKRPIELALGLALLWLAGLFISGLFMPEEPLRASLSLATTGRSTYLFRVHGASEHRIEVSVAEAFPEQEMERIVGRWYPPKPGRLEFAWEVHSRGVLLAEGPRSEYEHTRSAKRRGLILGDFPAEPGVPYVLSVDVLTGEPAWEPLNAEVRVTDPLVGELRISRQLTAVYIGAPLGLLLFTVIVVRLAAARIHEARARSAE